MECPSIDPEKEKPAGRWFPTGRLLILVKAVIQSQARLTLAAARGVNSHSLLCLPILCLAARCGVFHFI
ncbi:hypothetical protein DXA13_13175 [Clostridium sp. AM58-1XD]|nr:hypothetical protein DXA13_13175 [Clostridium sp. AM58-1XD]